MPSIVAPVRAYNRTVIERLKAEPAFARALLCEAGSEFLNGEGATARILLRDLVHGTVGFEELARRTGKPSKSLHRMLSAHGNPSSTTLALVMKVLREHLSVCFEVKSTND